MNGHVWLIGMMGSGKSAVARAAAARWDMPAIDTDDEVARRVGCSISQFWGDRGEEAFREMEEAALVRVAQGPPAVVATGGGVVTRPSNVEVMRSSGTVVWLSAPPAVLSARVGEGAGRPLLEDAPTPARLSEILDSRRSAYSAAADLVIEIGSDGVEAVIDRIEAAWKRS